MHYTKDNLTAPDDHGPTLWCRELRDDWLELHAENDRLQDNNAKLREHSETLMDQLHGAARDWLGLRKAATAWLELREVAADVVKAYEFAFIVTDMMDDVERLRIAAGIEAKKGTE